MAEKPAVRDVMTHLDEVPRKIGVARAAVWAEALARGDFTACAVPDPGKDER